MNGLGSAFGPPLTGMVILLVLVYLDRLSLFKLQIIRGEESECADVINIKNYLVEEESPIKEGPEQKELVG